MPANKNTRREPSLLVGSQVTVTVEKLAVGGAGVARHEGMVVFIPQAAPSETLLVEITEVKKNFSEAKILQIVKPSPSRRTPPCSVADVCGGCNWQHLTEQEQLLQKHTLVFDTLKKFLRDIPFEYLPIIPSPKSLRYRNRIQPKFKAPRFGFFERGSHQIVNISDCLITEEKLTEKFSEVRLWAEKQNSKELLKLEMYITPDENIEFGKIDRYDESIGFSQVNRFQNEDLIRIALDYIGSEAKYSRIYDLYAGSGNFTFPLRNKFPNTPITAVELNPKLVQKGRELSKELNISYVEADVEAFSKKQKFQKTDLIFLDPPRAGTSKLIMEKVASSAAHKIIYISCHPVALARDLQWFFAKASELKINYKLNRVQTFEMFPQTDHVETIAELILDS